MAIPLFAIGIAAADWIAGRARLHMGERASAIKRATLITALCALAVAPAWFQVDRTDNPATAQPGVFPHASDSGDVYWVSSAVIVALACVTLLPLAAWAARALTAGQLGRVRLRPAAIVRAAAAATLIVAVPVGPWLLHQAAEGAYASRVYDTGAASVGPAPDAFADQAAHALQDGLAGQAGGLPVAIVALLRGSRARQARRDPAGAAAEEGTTTSRGQLVHD